VRQLIQSYRTGEMEVAEVPPPAVREGGAVVRTVRSLVSAGTEKMVVDLATRDTLGTVVSLRTGNPQALS